MGYTGTSTLKGGWKTMEWLMIAAFVYGAGYFLARIFPLPLLFGRMAVYLCEKDCFLQAFLWAKLSGNILLEEKIVGEIKDLHKSLELEIRKGDFPEENKIKECLLSLSILEEKGIYEKEAINYIPLIEASKRTKNAKMIRKIALFLPTNEWKRKAKEESRFIERGKGRK